MLYYFMVLLEIINGKSEAPVHRTKGCQALEVEVEVEKDCLEQLDQYNIEVPN